MPPNCEVCSNHVFSGRAPSLMCICENEKNLKEKENTVDINEDNRERFNSKPLPLLTQSSREFRQALNFLHQNSEPNDDQNEDSVEQQVSLLPDINTFNAQKPIGIISNNATSYAKSKKAQDLEIDPSWRQSNDKEYFPCIYAHTKRKAAKNVARQRSFRMLKSVWWADEIPELQLTTIYIINCRPNRISLPYVKTSTWY